MPELGVTRAVFLIAGLAQPRQAEPEFAAAVFACAGLGAFLFFGQAALFGFIGRDAGAELKARGGAGFFGPA